MPVGVFKYITFLIRVRFAEHTLGDIALLGTCWACHGHKISGWPGSGASSVRHREKCRRGDAVCIGSSRALKCWWSHGEKLHVT